FARSINGVSVDPRNNTISVSNVAAHSADAAGLLGWVERFDNVTRRGWVHTHLGRSRFEVVDNSTVRLTDIDYGSVVVVNLGNEREVGFIETVFPDVTSLYRWQIVDRAALPDVV